MQNHSRTQQGRSRMRQRIHPLLSHNNYTLHERFVEAFTHGTILMIKDASNQLKCVLSGSAKNMLIDFGISGILYYILEDTTAHPLCDRSANNTVYDALA